MVAISIKPPVAFHAGDTVKWLESLRDYLPADGFVVHVDFTNALNHYAVESSDHGDGKHLVVISAAVSNAFVAGSYRMGVAAVNVATGERYTVYATDIEIKTNLSAAGDIRSHVKKTLDALEAWIETRNQGVADYSIAGRAMKYWTIDEVIKMRSHYRKLYIQEQNAERIASGRKPRRRLLTRMQG